LRSINFENAAVWRSWQWGGKKIGSRRATLRGEMICPADQKNPPFWKENRFSRELLLSAYHLGDNNFPHYIKAIKDYAPFDLYAYPSTAYLLAEYNLRAGAGLQFSAAFTSSEMVSDYQREMIERSFQCKLYDWYSLAERVAAISSCEHQSYHVVEDYAVTELFPSGEGRLEVVGTTLFNDVMPLIRYRTGDFVRVGESKCACGRSFRHIISIDGREGINLITLEGGSIGIASLTLIPRGVPNLIETQIVQKALDEIIFRVVCTDNFSEKDERILLDNARMRISSSMKYRVEKVPFIEREKNGKFIPVVSRLIKQGGIKNEL
jgi:phenylacetate-CoA ligase